MRAEDHFNVNHNCRQRDCWTSFSRIMRENVVNPITISFSESINGIPMYYRSLQVSMTVEEARELAKNLTKIADLNQAEYDIQVERAKEWPK